MTNDLFRKGYLILLRVVAVLHQKELTGIIRAKLLYSCNLLFPIHRQARCLHLPYEVVRRCLQILAPPCPIRTLQGAVSEVVRLSQGLTAGDLCALASAVDSHLRQAKGGKDYISEGMPGTGTARPADMAKAQEQRRRRAYSATSDASAGEALRSDFHKARQGTRSEHESVIFLCRIPKLFSSGILSQYPPFLCFSLFLPVVPWQIFTIFLSELLI